jgi:hypothetical protein
MELWSSGFDAIWICGALRSRLPLKPLVTKALVLLRNVAGELLCIVSGSFFPDKFAPIATAVPIFLTAEFARDTVSAQIDLHLLVVNAFQEG